MKEFNNRTVIITGAANGIGYATAKVFLKEGANVVIADIDKDSGITALQQLSNKSQNCLFVQTDIGNENSIKSMVNQTIDKFGSISILVNCAACFIIKGIEATSEDWHKICTINIVGYALCAKHCLPYMIKENKGVIINVCSISALIAQPNFVTYSATKGAVASMTRCMALDLSKYNIRVNAVSPGTVWTKSNEDFHKRVLQMDKSAADQHHDIGGAHILQRTAYPEEIAESILFLASDKSSFITASNLIVDGGYTAI